MCRPNYFEKRFLLPQALTTSEITSTPTWMISPAQTAASLMKTTSLHPWSWENHKLESWRGTFHVCPLQVWIYSTPFLTSRSCHSKSTQVFLHLQPVRDFSVMQDSCSLLNDHSFTARTLRANYC